MIKTEKEKAAAALEKNMSRSPCRGCPNDAACSRGYKCQKLRDWITVCWRDLQVVYGRRKRR